MAGSAILIAALAVGVPGVALYLIGPTLDRWEAWLKAEMARFPRQ